MMLAWPVLAGLALSTAASSRFVVWSSDRLAVGDLTGAGPPRRTLTLLLTTSLAVSAVVADSMLAFTLFVLSSHLLAIIACVDLSEQRIPNALTYPVMLACAVAGIGGVVVGLTSQVTAASIGSLAFSSTLLAPHVWSERLMGLGDVKLAVVLGFGIGWAHGEPLTVVPVIGWTIAAACTIGLALALGGRRARPDERGGAGAVAFGPALGAAGWGAAALALWEQSGVS